MRKVNDYDAQLERDKRVLREGVTREALEVLRRRYGYDLPLFGADCMNSDANNDKFFRQALVKEGQRQVISFILFCNNSHE
jgi:hypothetical protein